MSKMRLGWYAGASSALAGSVVLSAFYQRSNFYSAMVYFAQSNFCLLILLNFTLIVYSSFLYSLTRLCFGRLRAVEIEQLTERAWFAITETCLAMTIFREEIGAWFLVMFTALVTGKVWGWIGDGRVEVLEQQPPANPRLFHLRLSISLAASFIYDVWLLRYTINTVIQQARPNMMVMFLFEFAVLATCSWRTGVRYLLSITEQNIVKSQTQKRLLERRREVREQRLAMLRQREQAEAAGEEPPANQEPLPNEDDVDEMDIEVPGWASKGEWVLWLDLITDMIKLGIYVAFFFMLLMFYGLPIHIIRDLFMTSRDFLKRLTALLRYRRAIQEMNRYPDATEEELAQENTCIICREEMRPWDPENTGAVDRTRPKKLPCGHTLHLGCLKSWLERQQVCPTCRSPVTVDRARAFPNRRMGLRIQVGGNGQQGAAQQGANAPDPGAADGQQQQQPQQAPGPHDNQQPENRPRIFNLGPLRLGFGANGAQVRELARQFGAQPGVGNVGAAPAVPAAPSPGTTAQPPSSNDNLQNAAHLLQQAEQAFQREMSALDLRLRELQTCDLLLAELQRIRQRHALLDQTTAVNTLPGSSPNLSFPASLSPNTGGVFPHQVPSFPSVPARINSPLLGRHGTTSYTTEIPAGSPDLPDGVVIPPGWSLMPLQRLSGIQPPRQPSPHPGPAPPSVPSTEPESGASPAGDAHGRSVRPTEASSDAHASRSIPAVHTSRTTADTPVVSPSPVLPNWGGPAQLFGSSARLDATSAMESQLEPAAQAAAEPAAADQSSQDTQPAAEKDGKGKGRAVTVEEVPEADDDEDEDDSEDE
ncbi:unnamed protein product [Clonostachys rhizophaga]|uniref:RING-type E3 ubiquitin transferase n=1 Tax=Clonostachys rhizophaga TaxID=160324 RepID=A0A9N9VAM9_9HYPO|nr:unnamed protein product [Clonostachys rhizophaga]